jgi:hypothetical protein
MITRQQTAELLDARLQERLRRLEACILRCSPALHHEAEKELPGLRALASWIHVPGLQEQLQVLEKLVKGLMLVGGNSRERILCHLFRVFLRLLHPARRDLQQLLQQRLAQLDAGRQAGLAEPRVPPACPLGLLQQAGEFLRPHTSPVYGIKALLVCRVAAIEQLHSVLHYRMQELAEACRHNEWTLEACVRSGLARRARQLVQLAAFAPDMLDKLGRLEQMLLRLHLHGGVADQVAALQQVLQNLILGKYLAEPLELVFGLAAMQDRVLVSDDKTRAELIEVSKKLRHVFLIAREGEEFQVSDFLLRAVDRLGWMLDAVGHYSLGLAAHALAHACLQHWQWRQPIGASMFDKVQQFLLALKDVIDDGDCSCEPGFNLASSFLAECPEHGQGLEAATHIALNLANQFEILVVVRKDMFVTRESFLQHSRLLQEELRLLEQGAARVRLRGLEQFTSLLLDIHHLWSVESRESHFPADLLWRGHQQLLAMLDAAALWFEPLPEQELMQQLAEWVRNAELLLGSAAASLSATALHNSLQVALTAFARKAGNLLGRPVRLMLDVGEIGAARQLQMVPVLTEVLRWLLLQGTMDANEGSSQHRTRSLVVQIQSRSLPGAKVQTLIADDSGSKLPDQRMRRRLQRLFQACEIQLKAEWQHGKRILELEFTA